MISSLMFRLQEPIRGFRFPKVEGLEPLRQLNDSSLVLIGEYLSPRDLERLTRVSERIKHLAFYSPSEGGEPVWTRLYRRDHAPLMAIAEQSLHQKATRFRNLRLKRSTDLSLSHPPRSGGFSALRVRAIAALEQFSTWPAKRADVLAHLYPVHLSVPTYASQQTLQGHAYAVLDVIQLADGRLASASRDGTIRVWPLDGGEPLVLVGHNNSVTCIIQLEDGRLASTSTDGVIRIWSLNGGEPQVLAGHNGRVRHVIQLADGRLASASDDGTIRIWSLNGGATRVLAGHNKAVRHIIQLADGRIASVSDDSTIRIWPLDGRAPLVLTGQNRVLRIIQLVDGRLASASTDGIIRIWSLNGGATQILAGHTSLVFDIMQLADGRLASASDDGTIRISSLNGGATQVLAGHGSSVLRIVQLENGCIASASQDHTIRIWGPNINDLNLVRTATRQARYRKATQKISRKAILALGFVLLAWGVNALLTTIVRGSTHTMGVQAS